MTSKGKLTNRLWTDVDNKLNYMVSIWFKGFEKYGFDLESYKKADTTKLLISNIRTCITRKNKSYVFNK